MKTKTHKAVMLPTEKESNLLLVVTDLMEYKDRKKGALEFHDSPHKQDTYFQPQHLYILSDDEIKVGDWCMLLDSFGTPMLGEPQQYLATKGQVLNDGLRKVVSTTDKSLTNCSVCGMSNNDHKMSCKTPSLRTNLPAIPESFIQAFIKAYNEGKPITEVDLEVINFIKAHTCENIKDCNETCESKKISSTRIKTRSDNTVIIHQTAQLDLKPYKDMILSCIKARMDRTTSDYYYELSKVFYLIKKRL